MPTHEEHLFYRALRLPHDDRDAFLAEVCGGDRQLHRRLEMLLKANDQEQSLLDRPIAENILTKTLSPEAIDTTVGSYTLGKQLGEGTFGVVYVAEQTRPIRRAVALKIVKPGLDSTEILARFEAERQTLALMEHPNIALILDGGTTQGGRPYFVMELVRGVPITQYCDQQSLTIRERLELFRIVCGAVEHAHQKGVIHRDLKPSNILVTIRDGEAVPKIIDFGVAKVMAAHVLDVTISTHCAQLIGTPAYMSPEQAELSNVDVDTRSDVYSLGVLLHELLAGDTPHAWEELQKLRLDELRRVIQEVDPLPPSRAIDKLNADRRELVARCRGSDIRHLQRDCRGELDWIVLKALSRHRDARYQSAGALAADISKYLAGEAVEAGPPSTVYRLRKFARRNRRLLVTAVSVAMILIGATCVSVLYSIRAKIAEQDAARLRDAAEKNAAIAEAHADEARQLLYASDVRMAAEASFGDDLSRMRELLAYHVPNQSEADRRGFEWHYLWKRSVIDSDVVATFDYPLYCIALSPNGERLACCGASDDVTLFDAATLERGRTIDTNQGEVNGLAFSHDSQWLATTGDDGCVALWDAQTGKEIRRFRVHDKLAYQVAFSPDDSELITCGNEPTIRIWDPKTGISLENLEHHTDKVECLSVSPQGILAAGSRDHSTSVWDLLERRHLFTDGLNKDSGIVGTVAFSVHPPLLVTGTGRGRLSVIEVSGTPVVRFRQQLANGITALDIAGDSSAILVGDAAGLIHQVPATLSAKQAGSTDLAPKITRHWQAHDGSVGSVQLLPGEGGVISGGSDGRLKRSLLTTGDTDCRVDAPCSQFEFMSSDHLVAVHETIRIHDARRGHLLQESPSGIENYRHVTVAPDQGSLFVASKHLIISANIDDLQVVHGLFQTSPDKEVFGVAVSRDATRLAAFINDSVGRVHCLKILDTLNKRTLLTRGCDSINAMTFSPDGRLLAFSQNNDVCLLDVADGSLRGRLVGHGDSLQTLAFSPNGQWLASGSDDRTIRVWDVSECRQLWMTIGHHNSVRTLDFAPDGQTIVSGGDDSYLRLWNWSIGRMICELPSGREKLRQVRFSPDGNLVATLSSLRQISLHDGTPVDIEKP